MIRSNSNILALGLTLATTIVVGVTQNAYAADAKKGQSLFATRCASCHGDKGAGDGPIAAGLPPEQKPRNLQGKEMKFATTDDKFKELMKKGGASVGLSVLMPAQADLSDSDLNDLIAFINTLKTK